MDYLLFLGSETSFHASILLPLEKLDNDKLANILDICQWDRKRLWKTLPCTTFHKNVF